MTNKDIKNAYVGTTEVKAMYLGSTKVYPTGPKGVYILDIDNKLFKRINGILKIILKQWV